MGTPASTPKSILLLIHLPVISDKLDRSHLLRSHVCQAGMPISWGS